MPATGIFEPQMYSLLCTFLCQNDCQMSIGQEELLVLLESHRQETCREQMFPFHVFLKQRAARSPAQCCHLEKVFEKTVFRIFSEGVGRGGRAIFTTSNEAHNDLLPEGLIS